MLFLPFRLFTCKCLTVITAPYGIPSRLPTGIKKEQEQETPGAEADGAQGLDAVARDRATGPAQQVLVGDSER